MVKTQIQLPEKLYQEAKRIAREYEMSFAEVVRRSLENQIPKYPPLPAEPWELKVLDQKLKPGITMEDINDAIHNDRERSLAG